MTALPDESIRDECYRCGYDLRGIANAGVCPECGLLAERSRRVTDELHDTRPRWLRSLSRGIDLILLAIFAPIGGSDSRGRIRSGRSGGSPVANPDADRRNRSGRGDGYFPRSTAFPDFIGQVTPDRKPSSGYLGALGGHFRVFSVAAVFAAARAGSAGSKRASG
jgi:hypothetical protein